MRDSPRKPDPGQNRVLASRVLSAAFLVVILASAVTLGATRFFGGTLPGSFGLQEALVIAVLLGLGAVLTGVEALLLYDRFDSLWLMPLLALGSLGVAAWVL